MLNLGIQFFAEPTNSRNLQQLQELITSQAIVNYWEAARLNNLPTLDEVLFPSETVMGREISWIEGRTGVPIVMKASAYDAEAVPRGVEGFSIKKGEMPFFKESTTLTEVMSSQLKQAVSNPYLNEAQVLNVIERAYDSQSRLIDGAHARAGQMAMQALTTGLVSVVSNGQVYTYDYGLDPDYQKSTAVAGWDDVDANILEDIENGIDLVEEATGVTPTRALINKKTLNLMLKNKGIKNDYVTTLGTAVGILTQESLRSYFLNKFGLNIQVYNRTYREKLGATPTHYIPDNTFVLFPEGQLGIKGFGDTPESEDLMYQLSTKISITSTNIAVVTTQKVDPVITTTKASMTTLPAFDQSPHIHIIDTAGA